MSFETLQLTITDSHADLLLNRPSALNSFNDKMAEELPLALSEIANRTDLRLLTIHGAGPVFMAGGDIKMMHEQLDVLPQHVLDMAHHLHQAIEIIRTLSFPVLGYVHGAVAGAGMSIMMACDLVLAHEKTEFSMAYNQLGVSPDGGASYFLPRHVGTKRAAELIFFSERFKAHKALELGLINWVADDCEFQSQVEHLSTHLLNGPTRAYAQTKMLLNESYDNSLATQLDREAHTFYELTKSKDFKAGVNAFVSKQPAVFTGE